MWLSAQMSMSYDNVLLSYNKGVELYEKQKYAAAKDQFRQAIDLVNDQNSEISANAHYYLASCAIELFHKDAEYLLREFVRNYSTSTRVKEAWFLLGNFNYRKRDWADAIAYYNEISPGDLSEPQRSEYLFKKGYAYFQENNNEAAADQFFQMKDEASVYYAPGIYYYAHINYASGNYATALKAFLSLESHPQFGEVVPYYIVQIHHFQKEYNELVSFGRPFLQRDDVQRKAEISRLVGEALFRQNEYDEALSFLEDFMDSRLPKQKDDYYVMGYAYYRNSNYDLAAEQFSKISYSDDSLAQNAAFHLGETYLKAGKKSYARNAYRAAAQSDYSEAITEDALFKFAQLSYELSYDPYDGAITAFKEYIARYPNTPRTKEAYDYLVNIYLTSKNYDAALNSIEEYDDPDIRLQEAYQRIAFNKGVSLYKEKAYAEAIRYFDKSLKFPVAKTIAAESKYWIAECHYYRASFKEAVSAYESFIYAPGAVLTAYFNTANYNIGYAYFQQDKFIEAPSWFRRYTAYSKEKDDAKLTDANLRIGDSYFMLNQYDAAFEYYEMADKIGKIDPDYAIYQMAMTLGLLKDLNGKLEQLNRLTANFEQSRYLDAAFYEIGRTHIALGNEDLALKNLQKVVSEFPGSSYVRKALVSIGQTHYNRQEDQQALDIFMQIIKDFPTYEDTREALVGIQNIYADQGKIEAYEQLINSLDFVSLSDLALDSLNYEAAETQYFNGQCKEAVAAFDKYLARFEKGIFGLNARYYRAECLQKMGMEEQAIKDFEFVANQPKNKFSEAALVQAARANYASRNYPDALAYYRRLSLLGEYKSNLIEAEVGQMRCNYILNNYQGAIANATIALESEKLDQKIAAEANLIIAKSNLKLESPDEAAMYLDKVINSGAPSQAAEATYLMARYEFNRDSLHSTESLVFEIVEAYQSESYWMGKAMLLLADVYMTRGDLFQAKATLQSIEDHYVGDDEVKLTAQEKLASIAAVEQEDKVESVPELEIIFDKMPKNQPIDTLQRAPITNDTIINE